MRRFAILAGIITTLAGCGSEVVQEITGPISKAAARSVVAPIVEDKVPGALGEGLTECILDNASTEELILISAANAGAPSAEIVLLVSEILARDGTIACAAATISPDTLSEGA